jgi:hypothetical protein
MLTLTNHLKLDRFYVTTKRYIIFFAISIYIYYDTSSLRPGCKTSYTFICMASTQLAPMVFDKLVMPYYEPSIQLCNQTWCIFYFYHRLV